MVVRRGTVELAVCLMDRGGRLRAGEAVLGRWKGLAAEALRSRELVAALASAPGRTALTLTLALSRGQSVEASLVPGVFGDRELVAVTLRREGGAGVTTLRLSTRERQVAELVAAALRDKEIAAHLGISVETVRTHLRRIRRKHGFSARGELALHLLGG